jgi:hypothetical protein
MKSAALIRQLEAAGSRLDRVRRSHHVFRHPERPGAMAAAEEAASAWIDAALDAGEPVPRPSALEALRDDRDYKGWSFGVITLDPALLDDTIERVNITLPRRVLRRLDALARAAGESRSGYIAYLTLDGPKRSAGA